MVTQARSSTATTWIVGPRAASQHPVFPWGIAKPDAAIGGGTVVVIVPIVGAPLIEVAMQVIQAKRIGRKGRYLGGFLAIVTGFALAIAALVGLIFFAVVGASVVGQTGV
jgi:hypothetical protein